MNEATLAERTPVWERNRADPNRRHFSVLCYRSWCDYDFKIRDIPSMITAMTGETYPPATHLRKSECPMPHDCDCVCHDPVTPDSA